MSQDSKGGLGLTVKAGKDAAVVAKKQAERKKIQTVDLSKANCQLGKPLYSNGSERKQYKPSAEKLAQGSYSGSLRCFFPYLLDLTQRKIQTLGVLDGHQLNALILFCCKQGPNYVRGFCSCTSTS